MAPLLATGGPRYFYPRSPCGERLHYDNYNLHCVEISIHALLAESDVKAVEPGFVNNLFLSTLSLRRATTTLGAGSVSARDFYPRSPCGERQLVRMLNGPHSKFLSTLSLRRATSARPETRRRDAISIHALLAESDVLAWCFCGGACDFYPRSPCGERLLLLMLVGGNLKFLSTLSLRRATVLLNSSIIVMIFLSTLSLRRATVTPLR